MSVVEAAPRPPIDLRLALPVLAAWVVLGLVLGLGMEIASAAAFAVVTAVLGGLVLLVAGARGPRLLAPAVLAAAGCAAVLVSAAAWGEVRRPAVLLEAAEYSRHVEATAVLTQAVVEPGEGQHRVRAQLRSVRVAGESRGVDVPVTVFATFAHAAEVGDAVALSGTLLATQQADASAFLFFARGEPSVSQASAGLVAWAGGLRSAFRGLVEVLPGPGAGLLPGLAIGDTSAVDPALGEAMKVSSLTHLTAVSGANCAIVVGLVLVACGLLRLARWMRIWTSLIVLAGFVVIVTPEPSVLRAAVMTAVVLGSRLLGRGASGIPVLALAVIVLLVVDPWLALSYGFILSVLATTGLLVLAGPLARRMVRIMPRPIAVVIAVPLAAQLACQPVIILLTPALPVYGVVANVLAGPAAPVATVVGLVACLVHPLAPWLALPLAWLAWLPSSWIAAVAMFFGELPGAQLPWAEGALGLILAAVLTVFGLGVVLARRRRWWAAGLCLVLVVTGGVAGGERLRRMLDLPSGWQLALCDVGQGDAVLLRDGDAIMLVDTGPDAAALDRCLSTLGIDRIHTLVLPHFDLDHVGGVDAVVGRTDRVLTGLPDTPEDERLLAALAAEGAQVVPAARGMRGALGTLTWSVLWPPRFPAVAPGNDASVVLGVEGPPACECLSSVLLGDLGEEAQSRMLALARADLSAMGPVDVVKVAHHGSADQSERLYAALGARLGVIGVGENTYGHPTASILDTLARAGTTVARSDRDGLVLVWMLPEGVMGWWTERAGTPEEESAEESAKSRERGRRPPSNRRRGVGAGRGAGADTGAGG